MSHLLCFGLGYTARALARRLAGEGWTIIGTAREPAPPSPVRCFDRDHPLPREAFAGVTHILVSAPPDDFGDPVLDTHAADIAALTPSAAGGGGSEWGPARLRWLGYLSTTGVYGDRGGGQVDEASELRPSGARGRRRVVAERGWLDLWHSHGIPVHIFRLAAIYGPGRSPFEALRAGTAKRIDKPGQVFSRIHVQDLASVLLASMAQPRPGAVYNCCDDEPAEPAEVVAYAASLLGMPAPPLVPFEAADLSPMARSFWDDSKRVANTRMKQELSVTLRYPDYRAGLAAILAGDGRGSAGVPSTSDDGRVDTITPSGQNSVLGKSRVDNARR